MKNINLKKFALALSIGIAGFVSAAPAMANIVVDPAGHDPAQLQQDQLECRNLASSIEFDLASEHQGKPVLRGAVAAGGFAAIAGGGKEARRRSAAAGALGGGLVHNRAKRMDNSVESVQVKDAERNCLIGRGYQPIN